MATYSQFRPTGFDVAGLGLPDRQDWVVIVTRTRDSDVLGESNFAAALRILGGESDTCEVHRFGHWACGWFEVVLLDPCRATEAETIASMLEGYPVLDEDDLSAREWDAADELWSDTYDNRDRVHVLRRMSYTAESLAQLIAAARGDWAVASQILHCSTDIIYW